jgi:lactate 2-monooxygenase
MQWRILPRVMRPVEPFRNLSRGIFDRTLPAPIVMAPIGVQTLFHPTGERATSKVFGELGLPYTQSTATSTGFADVAAANGEGNPRWYQLYWPSDDDLTRSYLETAKANGFEVLVVTVDTWDLGWRTRDLDRGFFPFINGVGVQIGLEDPVAHQKLGFNPLANNATVPYHHYIKRNQSSLGECVQTERNLGRFADRAQGRAERGRREAGGAVWTGWSDCEQCKFFPCIFLAIERAKVYQHGGRQIDGAVGSLDTLPAIVEAVKGKLTIGFDGGIRSGADM